MPRVFHYRGYVRIRHNGESRQEHDLVAERALGRPLPDGSSVHHVDGNKRNNANRNLVICQDDSYHQLLHARTRILRAGGNPNTEKLCGRCGRVKTFIEFNRKTASPGGYQLQANCRECMHVRWREWYRGKKAKESAAKQAARKAKREAA